MKLASVIGVVIQTPNVFDWQFDLSSEALYNCSTTQVAVGSEKAMAYSYNPQQPHGGNPSPQKAILQCQDHVLASTCSTSQDATSSIHVKCDVTLLSCCLKKVNESLESKIILGITHPLQTNLCA